MRSLMCSGLVGLVMAATTSVGASAGSASPAGTPAESPWLGPLNYFKTVVEPATHPKPLGKRDLVIDACRDAVKDRLTQPNSMRFGLYGGQGPVAAGLRRWVTFDFTANNGLGIRASWTARCIVVPEGDVGQWRSISTTIR